MEAIARTLQHQLQQERQVLTGEIQRAMSQVNSRVDDIEKVLGDKLGDAVGMLQDLAGVQKKQGEKLETVAAETQTLANRIVDLESRLQQIEAGGGGGPRGGNLLEDDAGNRKPALIIGGWDPDQPGDETLTKAQDVIRELQLDIDAEEGSVRPRTQKGICDPSFQCTQRRNTRRGQEKGHACSPASQGGRMLFWAGGGTAATVAYGSRLASPQQNAKGRNWQQKPRGSSWSWGEQPTAWRLSIPQARHGTMGAKSARGQRLSRGTTPRKLERGGLTLPRSPGTSG